MENNKFKIMRRDIEVLRELVIDFVLPEELLDRILLLEQARTRIHIPKSIDIGECSSDLYEDDE